MDNNPSDRKIQTHLPRLSSTSYVYPVKSLLEGRIQPAGSRLTKSAISASQSSDDLASFQGRYGGSRPSLSPELEKSAIWAIDVYNSSLENSEDPLSREQSGTALDYRELLPSMVASSQERKKTRKRASTTSSIPSSFSSCHDEGKAQEVVPSTSQKQSSSKPRRGPPIPNYSHFPGGSTPHFTHTFSSVKNTPYNIPESSIPSEPPSFTHRQPPSTSTTPSQHFGSSSVHSAVLPPKPSQIQGSHTLPGESGESGPSKSKPSSSKVTSNAFPGVAIFEEETQPTPHADKVHSTSAVLQGPPLRDDTASMASYFGHGGNKVYDKDETGHMPFNPSEYGIVHLPPLPASTSGSERASSSSYVRKGKRSKNTLHQLLSRAGSRTGTNSTSSRDPQGPSSSGSEIITSGQHSFQVPSEASSGDESGNIGLHSQEPHISVRFRSMKDEHGNHVIIGREGTLIRCEDEPIRTPGSVQAFGVLIAVDEVGDTLTVRQVSENSTELLGLPPRYLFDLECFTNTLPEDQANLLWDNIEFLNDPALSSEEEDISPHIFVLSGWGAPGTALPGDPNTSGNDGRRFWTCWCAVHRSEGLGPSGSLGLIVMEFELENDTFNPLYSSVSPSSNEHGTSSPMHKEKSEVNRLSPGLGSDQSTAGKSSAAGSTPSLQSLQRIPPDRGSGTTSGSLHGMKGDENWTPSAEDIIESTTIRSKPIPALERLRRMTRETASFGNSLPEGPHSSRRGTRRTSKSNLSYTAMDVLSVMSQINEQLGTAPDLDTFLQVVVGVIKDLTQFHRVMVYQFDEVWNGKVIAELVDWSQSHDLFRGLHFPATDIPAQARQLYTLNKVRLLYNCAQPSARIVAREKADLERPLDMTHCYLRAMSPIHITYLQNMGVRASMSISIMAFGRLWGLITCHSYGTNGMRVSFAVRQMLHLLSQSISKNIERLSYAQRLHTRKLISALTSKRHPTGYIVSNADDLLGLFDADFGILVIGEGAKILGPNQYGQEILIMAEYLRLKQFATIQASQAVVADFPDLELTTGFEIIAGLLYVPLSSGGKDFIAFLRRGQPQQVNWAGKPYKDDQSQSGASLEPRKSFKIWSETIAGRSKEWTEEHLDTAGVLAFVYGKFIEVWREKETAVHATKITNLLLSNASHEVRTPLNHIINYLELAMNGPIDSETRDNLRKSHAASKASPESTRLSIPQNLTSRLQSLLFTINDLLDLTRLESGIETSFNELFDLHIAIQEATRLYMNEAQRRNINFILDVLDSPVMVVGDVKKIRTVVQNLTANALKYTTSGSITVSCRTYGEPEGLRRSDSAAVEIIVADTGRGIGPARLESIFREFEQVESSHQPKLKSDGGVGLGLAVVARIVEQLGGQLRVESEVNKGSQFSFLIPLLLPVEASSSMQASKSRGTSQSSGSLKISHGTSRSRSLLSGVDLESLVNDLSSNHIALKSRRSSLNDEVQEKIERPKLPNRKLSSQGIFGVSNSEPERLPSRESNTVSSAENANLQSTSSRSTIPLPSSDSRPEITRDHHKLKVLIVEDNDINRIVLAKRLTLSGHTVTNATNGQEGFDKVVSDPTIDLVLMDIQMPILNGFESTKRIRKFEEESNLIGSSQRLSQILNGRIPIFVVSASLQEQERHDLSGYGVDGWILKPVDFSRLNEILRGVIEPQQRHRDVYTPGCNWEAGGWLKERGS